MYQQANNHWLRKLAHGREVYLIPAGDIAAVVFTVNCSRSSETEASTWTVSPTSELDRMGNYWTRQPTQNTLPSDSELASCSNDGPGLPTRDRPPPKINWLNFVNAPGKTLATQPHLQERAHRHPVLPAHPFNGP